MQNFNFIALDVETANVTVDSICQIGLARFSAGHLVETFETLLNPEEDFEARLTRIHHIGPCDVITSPKFPEIHPTLSRWVENQVVLHYGAFDYASIRNASLKYSLPVIPSTWVDVSKIVRSILYGYMSDGYSLAEVSRFMDIHFHPHNALEDAKAAGQIFLRLAQDTHADIPAWVRQYGQPLIIDPAEAATFKNANKIVYNANVARSGCAEGPLKGQVIVFTGELTISRTEAAQIAANSGCDVADTVTKRTTILVVGERDKAFLSISQKSGKQRKAEEMNAKGANIRILGENEFISLTRA